MMDHTCGSDSAECAACVFEDVACNAAVSEREAIVKFLGRLASFYSNSYVAEQLTNAADRISKGEHLE